MSSYKILIVEDEMISAMALQDALERAGYEVTELAGTGEEALVSLNTNPPDLILMDINLEAKDDGIMLGKKILQEYQLPVIFITAYADRATISRAREVFPYGYIVKPWQENELLAVLETAIFKHLADRQAQELYATRNKFFSIIGHDLRSPLAALEIATRTLRKHAATLSADEIKEFVDDIHHTVSTLYAFTDNMLEWAKVQSGRLEINSVALPLLPLLEEVQQLLHGKASEKGVSLTQGVAPEITIYADKNMIRSVLLNLMTNGLKFSYPGGNVHVAASLNGNNEAVIAVSDKGVGMEEASIDQLLSFNTTVHTPGTQQEKGTGLGLLLCKEFVEANGGSLNIASKAGQGTTVYFSIPLAC